MLHELKDVPGIRRFLIANMVYQDGLVALFAFGGIYGAGVFGWQATELGVFGILLALAGTVGALAGGRLDDAIGSKPVVLASIAALGADLCRHSLGGAGACVFHCCGRGAKAG